MPGRPLAALLCAVGVSSAVLAAAPSAIASAPGTAPRTAAAVVDIATACGGSPRASFPDRPAGPAGEAVDCVARYGITSGDASGRYQPGGGVSRGQMASFLFRVGTVTGAGLTVPGLSRFPDVDPVSAHARAIDAVAAGGLTSGQADGTYGAAAPVSRAQMATFLDRLVTAIDPAVPTSASDAFSDDAGVHEPAINRIAALGLATGTGDGRFDPQSPVSRQQMALFLARTLALVTARTGATPASPTELAVVVTGLPAGVPARVRVDGPGGGAALADSTVLRGTGEYVISASPVPVSDGTWWPATRGGLAVPAPAAATSAEEVLVPASGAGASVQVRYGTFVPRTTLVLTAEQTEQTTLDGVGVLAPVALTGYTHVVGQPVAAHPAGFTLRLDRVSGTAATSTPVPFSEAIPFGAMEAAPGESGTFRAQAGPVPTDEALPCGGAELRLSHLATFTLEVEPRVDWGLRTTGEVAIHTDHAATTGLQLSGGACEEFEVPIAPFAGSKRFRVGPVETKVAWGPRVYGELRLTGEATAEVTRRERDTLRLRLPMGGGAQLTASHRVDDMRVAVVDGGLTLGGEFGMKVGVVLQGGPFEVRTDVGARIAGDITSRPGIPATRLDCSVRLELFAEAVGRFHGRGVAAEATASVPAYRCPPPVVPPVLGVPGLMGPWGEGWGTARPPVVYNGGVPSGMAYDITWRGWGEADAYGEGWTSLYRPEGGYYGEPGRIELRATDLGRCRPDGPSTYRELLARVPEVPGGPLGDWFEWGAGGGDDLCEPL